MRTYVGLICSGADDVEEDVIEEVVLSEERFTRYCTIGSTEEAVLYPSSNRKVLCLAAACRS